MRPPLAVMALVGCALPTALADLTKHDKSHHRSSSTSTSTSTTTTTETPTTKPGEPLSPANNYSTDTFDFAAIAGNIPFISQIDVIKIHLPLPPIWPRNNTAPSGDKGVSGASDDTDSGLVVRPGADGHGRPPLNPQPPAIEAPQVPDVPEAPELPETPGSTDSSESPEDDEPAEPAPEEGEVVIPDIATFDAVFANRSRLADKIRVFAFGGVYEIIVNRTSSSVEVVMIRALPRNTTEDSADQDSTQDGAALQAAPAPGEKRPLMTMRAPSITARGHSEEASDAGSGDENPADDADMPPLPDGKKNAVFINGSAVIGVQLGVVTFNSSGLFKLNVSVAEDFMTVILSQIGDLEDAEVAHKSDLPAVAGHTKEVGKSGDNLGSLRASSGARQSKDDPSSGSGGPSATTIFLAIAVVGAVATLGAAYLFSRSRARTQGAAFARRGDDYGAFAYMGDDTDAVEFGQDATHFTRGQGAAQRYYE